jgi:hypothetical protein
MTRSSTGNIHVVTTIPHDRDTRTSILTVAEALLAEEAEHVDEAAPVALGYGDVFAPMSLELQFLGQQVPWGPNGEFECLHCGDVHWYRKCNVPASLEELAGQHASTWPHVTPVVGNKSGAPPITQVPSMSSVGSEANPYNRQVSGAAGSRAAATSTVQRGPLQTLDRSMIDLQHRVSGLEREPSPVPGVTVPLDYLPAGIYQGRRVWVAPVAEEDLAGHGNGP